MPYRDTPPWQTDPRSRALHAARLNNDVEAEWLIKRAERMEQGWSDKVWWLYLPGGVRAPWSSAGYRFYEQKAGVTDGVVPVLIRMLMEFEASLRRRDGRTEMNLYHVILETRFGDHDWVVCADSCEAAKAAVLEILNELATLEGDPGGPYSLAEQLAVKKFDSRVVNIETIVQGGG